MLSLLEKYAHYVVFLVLEGICLYLIVNYNQTQRSIYVHSSSRITGSILSQRARLDEYTQLHEANQRLHRENAQLIKEILQLNDRINMLELSSGGSYDTTDISIVPVRIIKQDILSTRNHITINAGTSDGISSSMGLVTDDGVLGIITHASDHYATAISLLNVDVAISASVRGSDYFGTISWRGRDVDELVLTGIPKHAQISPGDTVLTNGYSTIFPSGIPIGRIIDGQLDRTDQYYEFRVDPIVDYARATRAYAILRHDADDIQNISADEQ